VNTQFCHSTCATCNLLNNIGQCARCLSTLPSLNYNAFAGGLTFGPCVLTSTNKVQYLYTINKNTAIGTNLRSVTYNTATMLTSGTLLSSCLYTVDVIEFTTLTRNTVAFGIADLGVHQKMVVRARFYTECTTENKTVLMTLSGTTPVTVTSDLISLTETIIEDEVVHNTSTFTITFKFGTQTDTCKKQLQDISLYSQKCADFCVSNDCPDLTPYYQDPFLPRCVENCQDGYTENGTSCVILEMCHSTCGTCSVKNNADQCLTCSSVFTSLSYVPFATGQTVGSCAVTATSNAQLLITVNKNTVLGTS
jgi:hypothetical protein